VELCYQTFGSPDDDPLLLVMGLGGPMTWWEPAFCEALAAQGFFVITYDNRDVGRSTKVPGRVTRRMILRAFSGLRVSAPYTLSDLGADGFALLDHLGIDTAHIAGISMGGMIVQTMALDRPGRVRSMASIMSTTGRRTVGWQHPQLAPLLLARRTNNRKAYVASSAKLWRIIGSPLYPDTDEAIRERAGDTYDRGVSAAGVARQMLAILTQPDRTRLLHSLRIPTVVIHGLSDRMVHSSGGRATAQAVPGAELLLVPGMGHDLPAELQDTFVSAIRRNADRATAAG
jgi:pimeloyl-ACP methyl ester carboxylesterase